ncbi:elastin-like isoform X1 [Capsicum annuum]|uniref:elastin-like isoform X1 n=1 Tax=Capsicum annuum TaxID=4072 RepID=UPI001FB109F1|nr:elastin-like isoform X1 [Capsicum annuum]
MGLKSFMLIVLAIFLAITSEVAGRKLSQSSTTSPDKGIGGLPIPRIPGIGELPRPRIPEIGVLPRSGLGGGFGGIGRANEVNEAKFLGSGGVPGRDGLSGAEISKIEGLPDVVIPIIGLPIPRIPGIGGYYPGDGYGGGYRRGGLYGGGLPRN